MARNLACDGIFQYGYDARNRVVKVIKIDRDSIGTLRSGSVIDAMRDEGVNRRIEKSANTPN